MIFKHLYNSVLKVELILFIPVVLSNFVINIDMTKYNEIKVISVKELRTIYKQTMEEDLKLTDALTLSFDFRQKRDVKLINVSRILK